MIGRLIKGLLIGLIFGVGAGAALFYGAGVWKLGLLGYAIAAALGAITGLFAGKPIWSADGKIEAGLKAFAGALVAAGLMFAARQWLNFGLPNLFLPALLRDAQTAGAATFGTSPLTVLPAIATLLAVFFELDNTPAQGGDKPAQPKARIATKSGAAVAFEDDELDEEAASKGEKRKR